MLSKYMYALVYAPLMGGLNPILEYVGAVLIVSGVYMLSEHIMLPGFIVCVVGSGLYTVWAYRISSWGLLGLNAVMLIVNANGVLNSI